MTITSYDNLNNLDEFSFIGGTKKVLTFNSYDEDGVTPLNITGGVVTWVLCPFGQYNVTSLVKAGTIGGTGYYFTVTLNAADTATLNGKYIQQFSITDAGGNTFRPGQGTILILPSVSTTAALESTGAAYPGVISGYIGGWTIGTTFLVSGSGGTTVGLDTGGINPSIYAGSNTPYSAPFRVTNAGVLTAQSGTVGGWTLGVNSLTSGSGSNSVGIDNGGINPSFYAGSATPGSAPFRVTNAGALTSSSGVVGGWTLGITSLTSGSGTTTVGLDSGGINPAIYAGSATPSSSPFQVSNAGDLTASAGTIGTCEIGATFIGSTNFVSGPLGSGWKISNNGSAEFQNAIVRGIIHTSVFEKDTISCINGMVLISKADVLALDMTALDASNLTIKGDTGFVANEVIRIKDGVDDEWILVTSAASAPQYAVTRDLAGVYSPNENPVWKKGTAVVSMGVGTGTKTGFIMMDSSSANSPYIDIYGRNSNTYTDYTLHARLGWLKGITDANVGLSTTDVWGLYSDSVYLKGVIVADTGYIGGTSGWAIGTGTISSTGITLTSGASASIAFGTTPPTSPTVGTGIYADKTGIYGLSANVLQAKFDAATGAITAGAGSVGADATGYWIIQGSTFDPVKSYKFFDGAGNYSGGISSLVNTYNWIKLSGESSIYDNFIDIYAKGSGAYSGIQLVTDKNDLIQINNGTSIGGTTIYLQASSSATNINMTSGLITIDAASTTIQTGALNVGTSNATSAGNLAYSGTIQSYKNSTLYTGSIFIPLAAPLTSTSWDGDAHSTTAKTLIDLSSVFSAPAGIKGALINARINDSGSAAGVANLILSPNSTAGSGLYITCSGSTNDSIIANSVSVPCDANGDIYYQITATGSNTLDVILGIWGYWI